MSDPIDRELRRRLLERQKDERIAQQHAAALAKLPRTREQELERENAALRAEVAHLQWQLERESGAERLKHFRSIPLRQRLSKRAVNVLDRCGVEISEEVISSMTEDDLRKFRGLGRVIFKELEIVLRDSGYVIQRNSGCRLRQR